VARPEGGPSILVVDDEPDILTTLGGFLETRLKAKVHTANSGREGLAFLAQHPVDLIISDYKMPGMDGLVFLAKANEVAPQAVRIMITAYADLDLAIGAINEARILHFFTKPIDPDHFVEVLATVLQAQVATRKRDAALQRSLELMRKRRL
jgi:DNA-binding NtrC family response regulator